MKAEVRIKQLERHLVLVKAESDGYASELLAVQKDCIEARKAGMREVVEFYESWELVSGLKRGKLRDFLVARQAKLKEWGL